MRRIFLRRRAQSLMEYTMLIMVITAALMAMYQYMSRSVNARLRQVQEELSEARR